MHAEHTGVGECMQNTTGHGRRALHSSLLLRPPKSHEPEHSRPVPGFGTVSWFTKGSSQHTAQT